MSYDPLPADEQVRRQKPLPKWWHEIDKIPLDTHKNSEKRDHNISGIDAIYNCLKRQKIPIPCKEIAKLTGHKEVSASKWLNQLLDDGKITYDETKQRKYWRLLKNGELPIDRVGIRQGALRKRILRVLEQKPSEWMNPLDLRPILELTQTGTIIQSLQGLWRNGEVQRRRDPAIMDCSRRHLYQYRLLP